VKKFPLAFALIVVLTLAAVATSCGSGNHLVSVTVTPNPATINTPESVQLQAIGNYSNGTTAVLPFATWTASLSNIHVSNSGLATCSTGGPVSNMSFVSASVGAVSGIATVICNGPAI
jgi:hypothetical protein